MLERLRIGRPQLGVVAIAVGWLLVALPALLGGTLWFRDLLLYAYPQKLYVIERLRTGELPLWCGSWGTGRPHFGLIQPGSLDPLNVLLLLPRPFNVDLYNLVHLAIAMLGVRAWLRRRGSREDDAAVGGVLLGLSGYFASMLATNGTYAWGVAFVPWFLAALEAAAEAPNRGALVRASVAAAAACSMGVLAGDPMSAAFCGVAGLVTAMAARTPTGRRQAGVALAGGALLSGLLCAAQLLPALEVARTYRASGVTLRGASTFSVPLERLVEWLSPDALGAPLSAQWYTPSLYTRTANQRIMPLALSLYQGLALLPLAGLAVLRGKRFERALAALGVGALVLALGRHTPVWPFLFEHLSPVRQFRGPEKWWFVVALSLAALAARGLPLARDRARKAAIFACAAAVLLGVVAALDPFARLGGAPPVRGAMLIAAGWALAYAAAFGASMVPAVRSGLARWLPALVLLADLLVATVPLFWWAPARYAYATPPFVAAIAADRGGSPTGARVFRDVLLRFAGGADDVSAPVETLMPNLGLLDGVGHLDSYDAIKATRLRRIRDEVRRTPLELLRWWGTDYAVLGLPEPVLPGMHEIAREPHRGLRLVRVEATAPRAYLATETVTVASAEEALEAARSTSFLAGEMATVEGPRRATRGRCETTVSRPEQRELSCESEREGWLIVGESFDPVWKVTVDGAKVSAVRGNELYQAIPVPAGRSVVRMRVEPWGLALGGLLSLAGLVLSAALWLVSRRTRSGEAPTHGAPTEPSTR